MSVTDEPVTLDPAQVAAGFGDLADPGARGRRGAPLGRR